MSSLVPRRAPQPVQPDRLLSAQVADAERPGLIAVAHVQGAAFVSSVALHHACMLSRAADQAFRSSPLGEETYRSILMAFGTVAVTEIQSLSLQGRGLS
jgi:hypothetical protein